MNKCIVIDGNSLLFRAYYATAYPGVTIMRTKSGIPTNAVFAFANMIIKILKDNKKEEIIVAFDAHGKTFRHEECDTYKANRKPAPEDLLLQMPIARELLDSLGVFRYEEVGIEGDDVAGTVAKLASSKGKEVQVYTSDRDFLQLIDNNIKIYILKKGLSDIAIMDEKAVIDTYGFKPIQIIDFKGLRGDPSDNYKGIPGVGEKTAVKFIQEYGTFDKIVEACKGISSKVAQNIVEHEEEGRLSLHLAEIRTDCKLPFSLEDLTFNGYEFSKINEFCQKYELKSIINKIPPKLKKEESNVSLDIKSIEVTSFEGITIDNKIGLALEMEEGNYHKETVNGISIYSSKSYYISIENAKKDTKLLKALASNDIKKNVFDFKATKVALERYGIILNGLSFDVLLAAYLLDSSTRSDYESILNFLGVELKQEEKVDLFAPATSLICDQVAYYSYELEEKCLRELEKVDGLELFKEVEMPLCLVLSDIEIEGFPLDVDKLSDIGMEFRSNVARLETEIYAMAGKKFNISSSKQVGDILYTDLGLKGNKKASTSIDYLKTLVDEHPIVEKILEYRKYAKLVSTYIDGLISQVYEDSKIHAIFNQALTTTGRLSSSEPNLQNISTRDEESKTIKKAFHYKDEKLNIMSFDYSQIELRILASLSKCPGLIEVFNEGKDIHAATAKRVFHLDREPSEYERRKAKAVNFGIIYGISDWGLADQLGIPMKEAKDIISSFYTSYPEVGQFLQNIIFQVEKDGYVTTLLGRRRYLREIHDSNYQVREFAKRAAMNAPIQGTAADLIKIAMIKVEEYLSSSGLKTKMICQIHDELLFKVPDDEIDIVSVKIKDIMENAIPLDIKLVVEGGCGKSWFDAK